MKIPRPLDKVMDAVVSATPDDWDGKLAMVQDLSNLKGRALFTAPELYRDLWIEFCNIMSDHVGVTDLPWKRVVSEIVRAERDYKEFINE